MKEEEKKQRKNRNLPVLTSEVPKDYKKEKIEINNINILFSHHARHDR